MWFGTYSGGLIRYNGERFVAITAANGLFDDNVFAIVEDRAGFLWMSCNRGVFKVRKGMLNEFADGKIKSITGRSYGTAEGMRTFECNGGTQLSGCATTDGRLWFATADGFATIEPLSGDANTTPPPVVIEKALIDRKQIAVDTPADVEPGNGDLEFTYTALSFVAPDRVAFKYRLEGFDEEWVDAGNRRLANYTNIPPGTYTFRVIAANNDGVWNESGATLTFTLSPHFYQAIWFYAVAVLSIGLLGSLVYHFYRTYRDRAKVAERLAAQLAQAELQVLKMQLQPHFLFNTLHAISSLMHSDLDAADEMMARLGSLLRYTLESNGAQEVPLRQELVMLDHYLEIEQIRLADRLRVQMNIPSELHDVSVPNLILQPIVENAIRYGIAPRTTGGHMEITATRVGSDIRLQICDDGPGLDDRMREGVGLSNTRARLEQMYGARQRFSYANRPQGGMCVSMEFPIIRRIHDNGEAEHHEGIPDSHAHH
jgi:signal transduction histidine kinase